MVRLQCFRIKAKLLFCFSLLLLQMVYTDIRAQRITKPNETGPLHGLNVNTYTGNFYFQRSDLYIPGRGLPIDITFSYNSGRSQRDWGYGNGWSSFFSMQYYLTNDSVVIELEDGQNNVFLRSGNSFISEAGVYSVLTEYQNEKLLLTTKYGIKYYFDDNSHKQITRIEDRNGNSVIMNYTGDQVSSISDASGRQIVFNWENGHLSSIVDTNLSPSRELAYKYDVYGNFNRAY